MKYPLTGDTWTAKETQAVMNLIKARRFTMGAKTALFEKNFAKKFGSSHAHMTNSGSMANLLAVAALCYHPEHKLKPGDEVIVPALSWSTTYYPLLQYGLKPKFVDIHLKTLNIDLRAVEKAISPRTRMVVAVNILGNPAPLAKLRELCDKHRLYLFEDNCEAMGARLNGKYCGTFGHISTFSTFYSHQMHTIEGGLVATEDRDLSDILLCLRAHGWIRNVPPKSFLRKGIAPEKFPEEYRFVLPGYNGRPNELNAAIGIEQLKRFDKFVAQRRRNADYFHKVFRGDERFILQEENGESSWFAFTVLLHPDLRATRESVLGQLRKNKIEFRMVTGGNFLRHDVIKYFDYTQVGRLDNADLVHDRGFFVGNYPKDLKAEINHLQKVLDRAVK